MSFVFLATGTMKLMATPMMIEDFNHLGFGLWFMYLTGVLEVIGGGGVLIPRFSPFAALLVLLPICIGVFISQLTVFHHDWIHTVVFGLIVSSIVYLQRDALFPWVAAQTK